MAEFMGPVPTGDWGVATTVIASIWAMLIVTTMFLVLRLYCRAIRTRTLWWDDYLLIASWVFLLASTSLLTRVFHLGYTTTTFGSNTISPMNFAADDMHKLALGLSKTSFALTLLRFTSGWSRYLIIVLTVVMNVVFLTHCVLVWRAACGGESSFNFTPCWPASSGAYMNMIGSAFSAASDFILALLPIRVIMGLQMARNEKIGVAIATSIGVLAGAVAIVKSVKSLTISNIFDPQFGHNLAVLSIWIEAEPNATIIAASIPILRILFRDFQRYVTNSPSAGSYLKSNQRSGFHTHVSARDDTKVDATVIVQDNESERGILSNKNRLNDGIRTTREVVIGYDAGGDHQFGGHQGIELQARIPVYRSNN
ncbi:hypothetical protein BP6252_07373 [Coleophoma cylindrospora]|uniref:Rhodopsin domain-containing protein n=1 Tax=Coleophoma cylindrospora TaxID=1849047 RepID=A0A3D8RHN7_9HELO|nr:hypothetical protein BP6252_07373 [Coleophoma cylindrospora]